MQEFKHNLLGLMDLDFFDNPTVKKGIAVMFWQFFQLRKIARLLGDETQNIWTPNYQVSICAKSKNNCHQDYLQYLF
jgi:hypothetical protein